MWRRPRVVALDERLGRGRRRIEQPAEEGREVVEGAAVADVKRVLRVPLDGVRVEHVTRIEHALDPELHAWLELAGPGLEIGAGIAARGERGFGVETADLVLVERVEDLLADAKCIAIALVAAVEA